MTAAEIKDLVVQTVGAIGGAGTIVTLICLAWRSIMNGRSNKLLKANTLATNNLFDQMKDWFQKNVTGKIRVNVTAQLEALSADIRAQYLEQEEMLKTQMAVQNKLLFEMAELMLTSPKVSKDEKDRVHGIMNELHSLVSEKYLNPTSVVMINVQDDQPKLMVNSGEVSTMAEDDRTDLIQV